MPLQSKTAVICEYCSSEHTAFHGFRIHDETFSISKKDQFGVYECQNCGLVFVTPRPTQQELKEFFEKEYHSVRYREDLELIISQFYPNKSKFYLIKEWTKWNIRKLRKKILSVQEVNYEALIRKHAVDFGKKE